jgi:uncharacterized protein
MRLLSSCQFARSKYRACMWRASLVLLACAIKLLCLSPVSSVCCAANAPQKKPAVNPKPKSDPVVRLVSAAQKGTVNDAMRAIANGAPVDCRDQDGNTPLLIAVLHNNTAVARFLIQKGADVKATDKFGRTALHSVQDEPLAELLVKKGLDVNSRDKDFQMTPIFSQSLPILRVLRAAGADVNIRARKGMSPLMWHAYSNHLAGVRYLLSQGAEINAMNEEESTALDIAQRFQYRELAGYLKSAGAKTCKELKGQ